MKLKNHLENHLLFSFFCFAILAVLSMPSARAFNSEEHRLLGDLGAAQVKLPAGLKLPGAIEFRAQTPDEYSGNIKFAKKLAVGFASNHVDEYDPKKKKVQDNYYYSRFGQLDAFNKHIWIPPNQAAPPKTLLIPARVSQTPVKFTFGELMAFYGDYRRTVSVAPGGEGYLTNLDLPTVYFRRGNLTNSAYAPDPLPASKYLQAIASGLVPPYGSWGNTLSYTARDEYQDAGWWGDEMMRVAAINDWHFSNVAIAWYVGEHRLALHYVEKAKTDPNAWITALHHEANALHSLTDLFCTGHLVVSRDRTAYGIMRRSGVLNTPTVGWMNNVISIGGGKRDASGRLALNSSLPAITDPPAPRNNTLDWSVSFINDGPAAKENDYHNSFNKHGAVVRNLAGDKFQIFGDSKLRICPAASGNLITGTVKDSLQSLFDAYQELRSGKSVSDIDKKGSAFYRALKKVPVYIESDPDNYFLGRWTPYAGFAEELSGSKRLPEDWKRCVLDYLDGNGKPYKRSKACCEFEPTKVTTAAPTSALGIKVFQLRGKIDFKINGVKVNSSGETVGGWASNPRRVEITACMLDSCRLIARQAGNDNSFTDASGTWNCKFEEYNWKFTPLRFKSEPKITISRLSGSDAFKRNPRIFVEFSCPGTLRMECSGSSTWGTAQPKTVNLSEQAVLELDVKELSRPQ